MSAPESDHRGRPIRTFGRTGGRQLSPRRQTLIDERLPELSIPEAAPGTLDPVTLFNGVSEIWLEIGFGGGEHFIGQAARHPGVGFIGCEPFIEGMARALADAEDQGLLNVRFHMGDARDVIERLKPGSISRVFILFPDPWPKKRQQKRRLIQPDFLSALHSVCRSGAPVRFATDIESYADEALVKFLAHGGFEWKAEAADDWRAPPEDHIQTRYQEKQLGDCAPVWLDFHAR